MISRLFKHLDEALDAECSLEGKLLMNPEGKPALDNKGNPIYTVTLYSKNDEAARQEGNTVLSAIAHIFGMPPPEKQHSYLDSWTACGNSFVFCKKGLPQLRLYGGLDKTEPPYAVFQGDNTLVTFYNAPLHRKPKSSN